MILPETVVCPRMKTVVCPRIRSLLACLAFALALAATADVVDRIAATVNDVAIPESEVRKAMVVSALQPEPAESRDAFRGRVLDALIDQHLEYEDAQRFGSAPPDAAEIEAAMRRLQDRLRAEGKDPESEFTRAGLTAGEVRASLERQLAIQRYLRDRFNPVALADETKAREEYEKYYVPERRAARSRRRSRSGGRTFAKRPAWASTGSRFRFRPNGRGSPYRRSRK